MVAAGKRNCWLLDFELVNLNASRISSDLFGLPCQFMQIPWPDKAVLLISGYVRGDDERGRIIRRTLARYLVLMQVLTFQAVSTSGELNSLDFQVRNFYYSRASSDLFVSPSSPSISYFGSHPRGRPVYSRRTYGLR